MKKSDLNKEIDNLKNMKYSKEWSAAIFNLKNKVVGSKKSAQEATSNWGTANSMEIHQNYTDL